MKTANEYLDWLGYVEASYHIGDMMDEEWRNSVEWKIEEIQNEAYNQAIKDIIEAGCEQIDNYDDKVLVISVSSISELKKK